MSSITAIQLPIVSSIRRFTGTNACADQDTMGMACNALSSMPTALMKTFAMFTPIASTTQLCAQARACVTKDMKALAEFAIWMLNAKRPRTVDITRSVTREFVNVIMDMSATAQTCKSNFVESFNSTVIAFLDRCVPTGSCNGAYCAENANCRFDERVKVNYCHCPEGFVGDGVSECKSIPPACNVRNNCGLYASCSPNYR